MWTASSSCAAIVILCLVVGLQTLRSDNYFLGDDFGLVQHLHGLPAPRLVSYFVSDWTEGIYGFVLDELRPFLAFTYWLDARLFGPITVSGYHATNLVLHLLNALLVLAIARSIAPRESALAVLAGSLFVLMPSHAEPVSWISGRVDSLAALFYLGAFLCFVRFRLANRHAWLVGALLIFTCGLFAKQSLVTFPLLALAFDLFGPHLKDATARPSIARLWPHVPLFVVVALYLALRHALFGNAVREDLVTASLIKDFLVRQYFYVKNLLPIARSSPPTMKVVAALLAIGVLAVCGRWLLARRDAVPHAMQRLLFFGVVWYLITVAPMVVTYVSARHLYVTCAGLSIAMASLILPGDPVEERRRTNIRPVMAGILVALYALASTWNVSAWVASGVESQRFAAALPRLLQSVPRGSPVLVDVPEGNRDGYFWAWAMPFALQPPFTSEDLYDQFKIIERPYVYCCLAHQWWAAKKATVTSLMEAPVPQQVTYIAFAPQNGGAPVVTTRMVDGPALKRRIEAALGKSVESLTTSITPAEGEQLVRVLFDQGDQLE
jgi:hypothetical protein